METKHAILPFLIVVLSLALTACSTQNFAFKDTHIKYKVCWELKNGKNKGCGQHVTKESAEIWVDYGNTEYPNIHHWVKKD